MKKSVILFLFLLTCSDLLAQNKPTLTVFFDIECPICQNYTGRLQELYEKYKTQIDFKIVYPTKNTTRGDVRRFEREYSFKIPFVIDTEHIAVKKHDATTMPEVVFVSSNNEILYRGAIDNQFIGLGKFRPTTTEKYLQNAIENWLNNRVVNLQKTEPIGCLINRK
jgi:thiol-disulfide isomerase/thioredoxin